MYTYIKEQSKLDAVIPKLMGELSWGTDTETTGLDPFTSDVLALQIGRPEEQFIIDARTVKLEPLRPFLESRKIMKILHNAKFDYKMLKKFNIEMEYVRDTMLAEQIMRAGFARFQGIGLEDVVEKRLGVKLDKSIRESFINHTGDFTEKQLDYMADDVRYLNPLAKADSDELLAKGLAETFQLESDCVPAFADMEYEGMVLDVAAWREVLEKNKKRLLEVQAELDGIVEPYVGVNLFGEVQINYGSPVQVVKLLQMMKFKVKQYNRETRTEIEEEIKKSDKKTLQKLQGIPIVQMLQKWRSYEVRINTFGEPYIQAIHPKTGKLHPDFWQIGTGTGRPAAGAEGDVNPLNVPRDNEYRNCFTGGPDELVESDDYSGCELRILAEISGDPKMREIFNKGEDPHCAVATELYRVPVTKKNENKRLRTPGKSLNFGWRKLSRNQTHSIQGNPNFLIRKGQS